MGFGFGHAGHFAAGARSVSKNSSASSKQDYCALQGALVLVAGCSMLVGLGFGAFVVLAGPDGWISRAANTAVSEGPAVLTAYTINYGQ
jgi:hypothetical protein